MTTNQTRPRQLHYQITQSDHDALRSRLSAGTTSTASCVHRMFFASYRDRTAAQPIEELLVPAQEEARFTLQYMDNDPSYLILERRQDGDRTSAMVTEAECRALLSGETDWLLERRNPVLLDFYDGLTERMLLPQVLVSYRREVYIPEGLGLWVALDTDLRATLQHMDFLDPQRLAADTAEQEGRILMEIGYSDTIPDQVLCLLEETAPRRRLLQRR
ncbi:MAG: hypothetical protein K2P04_03240 [Oscillospiraceae bacterium]|jgi:hypothetical protein|nr:hypothetical protein [Oscillospiraceae bacterium]MDE6996879.1 hypothetical protein [Oscillospiraceae bacterium]